MAPKTQNPTVRYWEHVDITAGCWLWTGAKRKSYGVFWLKRGKNVPAHRYSYEFFKGRIPENLELDHLCRNKSCVNPYHLEAVTHRENGLRSDQICAVNHRKTHCPKGHLLSGKNLCKADLAQGHRKCRICLNERNRNNYAKKMEAVTQ